MKIIFYSILSIYIVGLINLVIQDLYSYKKPFKKKKKEILNNQWINPLADEQIKEENEIKKIVSKKPKINSKLI